MTLGWKLFEVAGLGADDYPRTLVHGMPCADGSPFIYTERDRQGGLRTWGRSRLYPLGQTIPMEPATKGFNLFPSFALLAEYLPRFRKRAPRLAACAVLYRPIESSHRSNYVLASEMLIRREDWAARRLGAAILFSKKTHSVKT